MKHQHNFRTPIDNRSREAVQTSALMSDLDRVIRIMDDDITREEQDAGVFNPSNPAYPLVATMLRARRDNLANTIALLETRLATSLEHPERMNGWRSPKRLLSDGAFPSMTTSAKKDNSLKKIREDRPQPTGQIIGLPAFQEHVRKDEESTPLQPRTTACAAVAAPSFGGMEHQGIEYRVVQTACPTGWKWTVQLPNSRSSTGRPSRKLEAISRAQLAIENALAIP